MEYLVDLDNLSFTHGFGTGVITSLMIPILCNVFCFFFNIIYRRFWASSEEIQKVEIHNYSNDSKEPTEHTEDIHDVEEEEDEIQNVISQTRRKRKRRKKDNDRIDHNDSVEHLSAAMKSLINGFPPGEFPIAKILSEIPSSTDRKYGSEESVDLAEEMKNLSGYMMGGFQPSDSKDLQKQFSEVLSDLPRIAEEIKSNPTIQEMKSLISKGEFTSDDFRKMQEGMSGLMSSVLNGKISEEEIEEQKQDSEIVLKRLNEIKISDSESMD